MDSSNSSQRADQSLVQRQLANSRTQAQRLISDGSVSVLLGGSWRTVTKASEKIANEAQMRVAAGAEQQFVSRGGLKLQGALEQFGIEVAGRRVLDVGQSTGGFTDCLLQMGVEIVIGVDVGRDQLASRLRSNPRVVCLEGINARELPAVDLLHYAPDGFDLIVMDVSFISQTLILPNLPALLAPKGKIVSLVKPQFEVGKANIGKGGIVRDTRLYAEVERKLREACAALNLTVLGYGDSPITGTDGNREFFICAMANE